MRPVYGHLCGFDPERAVGVPAREVPDVSSEPIASCSYTTMTVPNPHLSSCRAEIPTEMFERQLSDEQRATYLSYVAMKALQSGEIQVCFCRALFSALRG